MFSQACVKNSVHRGGGCLSGGCTPPPCLTDSPRWLLSNRAGIIWSLCKYNSIVAFTTNWNFWCCCIYCLFSANECQRLVYTHTYPFIPKYVLYFHWLYALFMNTRLVMMSVSLRTQTGLHCLIIQVLNTMSLIPKYSIHFFHFCTQ